MLLRSQPDEAIKLLHQLYYNNLLKLALAFTRDPATARDIVQETFLSVWTNRKELMNDHETSIENYVTRIVRNKSIDYFRRRRFVDIDDLDFLKTYTGTTNAVEVDMIRQELKYQMRSFILTFPIREQQCLLMKIDREMSLDQIAMELNISRKMVEKSQTRALKRLKNWASGQK